MYGSDVDAVGNLADDQTLTPMEHKGIPYSVGKSVDPNSWKWTVDTEHGTKFGTAGVAQHWADLALLERRQVDAADTPRQE